MCIRDRQVTLCDLIWQVTLRSCEISFLWKAIPFNQLPINHCGCTVADATPPQPALPLLDWQTVQLKMQWGVIMLLGGGFAIADAVKVSWRWNRRFISCYSRQWLDLYNTYDTFSGQFSPAPSWVRKSRRDRKLQFFDKHRKFPMEEIMDACWIF